MPWYLKEGRTAVRIVSGLSWRRRTGVRPHWRRAMLVVFLVVAVGAAEPATPHAFLEKLCDDFGGRLTGSVANAGAMERLATELRTLGYAPEKIPFTTPGWERGDDRVEVLAPFARRLRVAALGYAEAHAAFAADIVDLGNAKDADLDKLATRGCIGVLSPTTALQTSEIVAMAVARGLRAVLFINREGGGQLLARTGSFSGTPLPIPI